MTLSPRLALLLCVPPLLWAGNAVVGRLMVGHIGPLWLNAARWGLAFVLLWPLGRRALATPERRAAVRAHVPYLLLLSLTGVGAYNALQYLALRSSTPLNVTLIAASAPVWTMAIGAAAFGEWPRRAQLAGAALSLLGVATVLARGEPAALLRVHFVAGDLLMLAAIATWSVYSWLLARPPAGLQGAQRPDWDWAQFLMLQVAPGVVWGGAAALVGDAVAGHEAVRWSPALAAALLYIAVGPSLIAYRLWGLGVAQAGPAVAAFFGNLTPLFAALLSAAMLGEWPQPFHGLAFVLIVGGIAVSSRR